MMRLIQFTNENVNTAIWASSLNILSGEWKCVILSTLLIGTMHIDELQAHIPQINSKVLTEQISNLEKSGFIECVSNEKDCAVEYSITPLGRTLEPILLALQSWFERYDICRKDGETMNTIHIYE